MSNVVNNVVSLRVGENVAALKSKSDKAKAALTSPHPTLEQARDLTETLTSAWSDQLFTDHRRDGIAEMLTHFPVDIGTRCADRWNGIASTKIPDLRTGKLQPRRFPPSDGEIRDWCEDYVADLWKLAKAGDILDRAQMPSSAQSKPDPKPPTSEEIAHVWAKVAEVREGAKRVLGLPTLEEQRDRANQLLEKARQAAGSDDPQVEGTA
jgi:hypothetical protein